MLSRLSFNTKLLLLCTIMAIVSIVIGVFSYRGLYNVEESNGRVVHDVVPNLELVNTMGAAYRTVRIELRTLGYVGLSKKESELAIKNALVAIAEYEKSDKKYQSSHFFPGERELYNKLHTKWETFHALGKKVIALYRTGKPEDHEALLRIFLVDCPEIAASYQSIFDELMKFHNEHLVEFTAESKTITDTTNMFIINISIVGVLGSFFIGIFLSRKISKSINEIVRRLEGSADGVSAAASQIASSAEELSQATTEQAASLQETSSAIEEINSMINSNTENAKLSANASGKSLEQVEKGKKVVEQMVKSIGNINNSNNTIMEQINKNNQEMEDIVKLIAEIGNKTKVINDIVFQTKLLSFNASVEAARAGENGKGFAVVAQEVGNLAAMSGSAAIEISTMLENSVKKVEDIVKNSKEKIGLMISDAKSNVESGTVVANECASVLNEIVTSVAHVTGLISEISSAGQEQARGVDEITKSVSQLDRITQENTINAAESAVAAESLSHQSDVLKQLVHSLVVTMDGEVEVAPLELVNIAKKENKMDKVETSMKVPDVSEKIKKESQVKQSVILPSSSDARFQDV